MRIFILTFLLYTTLLPAQELDNLPFFQINELTFKGAFRLPADEFGGSSLNYSEGPIAFNKDHQSLYIVGHSQQQQIAEFAIPALGSTTILAELPIAGIPVQVFTSFFDRPGLVNPDGLDRIAGLWYQAEPSPALLLTAYEYYDAPGDNTRYAFYWNQADQLAQGNILALSLASAAPPAHLAGWISSVPEALQSTVGGPLLLGGSSGIPIISRTSVGPSAFVGDLNLTSGPLPDLVITSTLLDFSLEHPLASDLENASGTNDLWTHLSRVAYGMIVPGTRTYFTLGYSGGHESGVCYKCTQDNGNLCGGYCAPDHTDYQPYYWLWDLQDLLDVKNGKQASYSIQPYDHGAWDIPFVRDEQAIGGGAFDETTNTLYLSVQRADTLQGEYANPPVIAAYQFSTSTTFRETIHPSLLQAHPNPANDCLWITGVPLGSRMIILDSYGRKQGSTLIGSPHETISIAHLAPGLYFLETWDPATQSWQTLRFIKM